MPAPTMLAITTNVAIGMPNSEGISALGPDDGCIDFSSGSSEYLYFTVVAVKMEYTEGMGQTFRPHFNSDREHLMIASQRVILD